MMQLLNFMRETELMVELLFDHCVQRDLLEGTYSPEEIEFMSDEQKILKMVNGDLDKNFMPSLEGYDNFLKDSFEKLWQK